MLKKHFVLHVLDVLLLVMICGLAFYTVLLLFTGGAPDLIYGLKIKPWRIHIPIIGLLALWVMRSALRHRICSLHGFFAHQGTVLFSVFLIVYLANGKTFLTGDSIPARYLPLSILREGNFYLDAFPHLYSQGIPYFLQAVNGHYVSAYPIGAALLALPFYLPSALGSLGPESPFVVDLEKLAAAIIVALSAVVLYFVLVHLTSQRMALLITVIYALGTSSLSTSSQALWQHGARANSP